jgi:hypothetical protein
MSRVELQLVKNTRQASANSRNGLRDDGAVGAMNGGITFGLGESPRVLIRNRPDQRSILLSGSCRKSGGAIHVPQVGCEYDLRLTMAQHRVNPHTCTITVKETRFTHERVISLSETWSFPAQSLGWCCFAQRK